MISATVDTVHIYLNHHSGEPVYRQIVEAVKYRIAAGEVLPEAQLPSIRVLAEQLQINPRTVVKAYEELEHAGLVVMRHGQGVFVSPPSAAPAAARRSAMTALVRRTLAEAFRLGCGEQEILDIVQTELQRMEKR